MMPATNRQPDDRSKTTEQRAGEVARVVRVALVGHCGPDSWMLKGVVGRVFPGGAVAMVNDVQATLVHAVEGDLVLVNRKLDGDFESESGLTLIGALMALPKRKAAVMLVSNIAEAQAEAAALGAAAGFGKASAGTPEAARRMRAAVGMVG